MRRIVCCIVVCLLTGSVSAQQEKFVKVLFVGNSFTYFHNLPQVVSAMGESQGVRIITRQSTVGGSNLEQHWKGEKGTRTMKLLDSTKWDYVVFNNHSASAIDTPESFYEYGKKFAQHVKSKGAKPVFMMTWAYKSDPSMHQPIRDAYLKLGEQTNADVVPCGVLFEKVRTLKPELEMYFDDKHPSSNGTYLLALSFYKFFSNKNVSGIAERITTSDRDGEKLYLLFMHDEDADFLKKIVDETQFGNAN